MIPWPKKKDFIDFHSHHREQEKGVFRIYNQLIYNHKDNDFYGPRSIGLHPWDIKDLNLHEDLDDILENLVNKDYTLFVGECGLDKKIQISISSQVEIFSRHIQLSEKVRKPLIIHCVKAHQELMALKKEFNPRQKWIIHGFNGSPQLAGDLIAKGFKLSIGDSLLRKSDKAKEVLNRIQMEDLFIETDESDVSTRELYARVSRHLQLDNDELKRNIFDNFTKLFHNDE